jgi:hypothetical protein
MIGPSYRLAWMVGILSVLAICIGGADSSAAFAEACPHESAYADCAPGWALTTNEFPTTISPGAEGLIEVDVMNVGAAPSSGKVTVTDTLPGGVTASEAGELHANETHTITDEFWNCTIQPGPQANSIVTCTNNEETMPHLAAGSGTPNNSFPGPNYDPQIGIRVRVPNREIAEAQASSDPNRLAIAGGGAPTTAATQDPIVVSADPGTFRFANLDAWFSNANGTFDTRAGSHPYEATFSFNLASENNPVQSGSYPVGGNARSIDVELPSGFVGNPTVVPQCTSEQLDAHACPSSSQVGVIAVTVVFGVVFHAAVYNIVPPAGVTDQLGFEVEEIVTLINTGVRTGGDYGLTSVTPVVPERAITGAVLTLWGQPGDPSHNIWRGHNVFLGNGGGCTEGELASGECASPGAGAPFLTLPTQCGGPQSFSIKADSWEHQDIWTAPLTSVSHDSDHVPVGFTGCEHLSFNPSLSTAPDTGRTDSPAGLTVEVKPPVGGLMTPEGLSTSDIEDTTVTLPEGVVINPGQAVGLQACQENAEQSGIGTEDAPSCPAASKVGTVKIKTPLLEGSAEKELEGNVYVLQSNPPALHLLIAASGDGLNLKLVGVVHLNEATGRLTTTFGEQPEVEVNDPFLKGHLRLPQLPFTDFKLSFSGGAQAALDTPTGCGTYATSSTFGPWASPFLASLTSEAARFELTEGPGGGACPSNPLPFSPSLTAGSTTDQAGGFTDFSLLLQRGDGQQRIEKLSFTAPAGLGGMLSAVPLCGEPQASKGECPEASKIGHASVASGPGPYPLVIPQPGEPESPIYLTGPYGSAPFGLAIVTHVLAGPFNLGTIVTRARIAIDPHTAQVIVTTDPLPQVVDGVPTDLRLVNSVIDRPGFMFNPTSCNASSFSGTAWGTPPPGAGGPDASAPIGSHFQVGSCRSLEFAPKFSVSTSGKTSKAKGASLTAKVSYPSVPQGTQSDIASVKVELPKQLPSRLTTLQKACTNAQFEANPASCPSESKIGMAVVHTPELPVPLVGPAIFVSHGGEAFPSLTLVLQGDGVTIDLVGATFISKKGITSTTFKTVPDAPFSTFDLTLPEGKFSALAANGNLCTQKLVMPTEFTGQNGAVFDQSTKVGVTGCAKAKSLTRAQKLEAALRTCHKNKNKARRAGCEARARKRYGPLTQKKKKR